MPTDATSRAAATGGRPAIQRGGALSEAEVWARRGAGSIATSIATRGPRQHVKRTEDIPETHHGREDRDPNPEGSEDDELEEVHIEIGEQLAETTGCLLNLVGSHRDSHTTPTRCSTCAAHKGRAFAKFGMPRWEAKVCGCAGGPKSTSSLQYAHRSTLTDMLLT